MDAKSAKKIVLSVAKELQPYLKAAGVAAAGMGGKDAYLAAKRHLVHNKVSHSEHNHENDVPQGNHYIIFAL